MTAGLIGGVFYLFLGPLFKIKKIDCQKENFECNQKEKTIFSNLLGRNIFFIREDEQLNFLKDKNFAIKIISFKKVMPDKIEIRLEDRKPAVCLNKNEKIWYILDSDAFIIEKVFKRVEDLPQIFYDGKKVSWSVGQQINNQAIEKALLALKKLKDSFAFPLEVEIKEGEAIKLYLENDIIVLFSARKKINNQVDSLQFILRQSKIEGSLPHKIDLRFEKAVVKY